METIADLHIHSHFSRATGKLLNLENLDLWSYYKGLSLLGTGDCTHPGWLAEMAEKLIPVDEGVYALRPELALTRRVSGPAWESQPPVRFVLSGEISSIYKKGDRTRKVHTLVLLPSLEAAQSLSTRLARLGNVTSDGRPILGLDARYLLELILEVDPASLVIPAHIWTPWFSVLGSRSGFDSLEECYDDLTEYIYALETGLSSDPAMNWRLSNLDRFALVSNSDAHSAGKIGREANIFTVPPTYPALAQALRTKDGFAGTIEFFPEEGKYHLDGHRKCAQRLDPAVSKSLQGLCPVCDKPLTLGVLHRVLELADRANGDGPASAPPFQHLIPLGEILAEVLQVGVSSKKVEAAYFHLLQGLGPELKILRQDDEAAIARTGGNLLAHGISKMRAEDVHIQGGYDGEYGTIRLFEEAERQELSRQTPLWEVAVEVAQAPEIITQPSPPLLTEPGVTLPSPPAEKRQHDDPLLAGLNEGQSAAVRHRGDPLLVQAGPGTGKTRALTHRIAYLLQTGQAEPEQILGLTFTRQAAEEMRSRLRLLLPDFPKISDLSIKTFHALGAQILQEQGASERQVLTEEERRTLVGKVAGQNSLPLKELDGAITAYKQELIYPEELVRTAPGSKFLPAFQSYEEALSLLPAWDFEDLVARPVKLLESQPELLHRYRDRFVHLLVDEYQDLNQAQYALLRLLAGGPGTELFVIGDPNQAIYGFRGAQPEYFNRFTRDWPQATIINLTETYRLTPPILRAAQQILLKMPRANQLSLVSRRPGDHQPWLFEAASERAEAEQIARQIEALVGGTSHLALENDRLRHRRKEEAASFRDIAILYRFHALGQSLEKHLYAAGIPCQRAQETIGPEISGLDLKAEKVSLLTLHAAKGLEFPYVFIIGCETGLLPFESEQREGFDPQEERRLFYVGLTRATHQVFLSWARTRFLWGEKRRSRLSPLVQELSPDLLSRQIQNFCSPRNRRPRQKKLFDS
jgi:DNA helicase-2/ATP-dependent DNA helicase PcrA